ncbi:MAG: Uma2 family endonuclease [Isosphaeraceae bacterium]
MSTAIQIPPRPAIEYPDDDGKPMSENTLQYRWIVTIKEGIEAQFDGEPEVFVAADLLWYPVEGSNDIRNAPDVMVAFGRPKRDRSSYLQWEEGGVAPQVVFEIRSPGNRPHEMEEKLQFYERHGVEEYYVYDPANGALEGWRRRAHRLRKIPRMAGFTSPRLGARFEPGKGPNNLKIIGRNGEPFITPLEMSRQRNAERNCAEAERNRAEAERNRAEAERNRAEAYAAKLRELGIEPD